MKKKNGLTGKTDYDFSVALKQLEDLMDAVSIKYIVVGEVSKRLKESQSLDGLEKIEVAIPKLQLSEYAVSSLNTIIKGDWKHQTMNGIPVEFKVVERKYKFFKFPDKVVHWGAWFNIPNPMDVYWKSRFLVR